MKLEVGKYYRTRDGRKVGPMEMATCFGRFETRSFTIDGLNPIWHENGNRHVGSHSANDLIAEWQDEVEDDGFITCHTTRAHILDTAKEYVTKDRQATHGKPEDTFGLIAAYWSAHLDATVNASDVAAMMALLKLARIKMNPKHIDSYVDLAGYAACAGELADVG